MAGVLDRAAFINQVRSQLDEFRLRTGIRKGEEFDHALVAVEALAMTMAAMSEDAAALIEEGQRSVGAVVSATLTRQVLWRLAILPAAIGALIAALLCAVDHRATSAAAERIIAADHEAFQAQLDVEHQQFEQYRAGVQADLDRQRAVVEAERQRVEATLPSMLLDQARTLAGAAREIVQQEAATPGFEDFIARQGVAALRAAQANGGTLCPRIVWAGETALCQYRRP